MKRSTFLCSALALSSMFAPLKAQSKDGIFEIESSNISTNTESYKDSEVKKLNINGMPFLIYDDSDTTSTEKEANSEENHVSKEKLSNILSKDGSQDHSPLPPQQQDLLSLLEDLAKEDSQQRLKKETTKESLSFEKTATTTMNVSEKTSSSPDDELQRILSGNYPKPKLPRQKDLEDLLRDLDEMAQKEESQKSQEVEIASSTETKENPSAIRQDLKNEPTTNESSLPAVVDIQNTDPAQFKEELKTLLSKNEIKPRIVQNDLEDLLDELKKQDSAQKQEKEVIASNSSDNNISPQKTESEGISTIVDKPVVVDFPKVDINPSLAKNEEKKTTENHPVEETTPVQTTNTDETVIQNPASQYRSKDDDLKELLAILDKEEQKGGQVSVDTKLPKSDDNLPEKIAFWVWMSMLGAAAAVQGKKYFSKKKRTVSNYPESTPNSSENLPPSGPTVPPDLIPPYGVQLIPNDLILSVLKKKQEGTKLLPYYPEELDILPAKDPLLENNREVLAQRLFALKAIYEIQKERAILTKMIAKARRQQDENAIAVITARRKILSERIKKARLAVIGNQLDSIREQRRLLTKKITLARRHHDHWQVDSVQKQRATLKTKEKTVKGFVKQFNYSDYRHQWHLQRKNSLSRS